MSIKVAFIDDGSVPRISGDAMKLALRGFAIEYLVVPKEPDILREDGMSMGAVFEWKGILGDLGREKE
ncbi:unnamed protein product [Sphagnum balticum]